MGIFREAVTYLKKSLSANKSYPIARINLANILTRQCSYKSAYNYYKGSYNSLINKWPAKDRRSVALLNNYGVALTLAKKWNSGLSIFKRLTNRSSPQAEVLLNYAVFLAEKSKAENRTKAVKTLSSAKGIADELTLYKNSAHLSRKLRSLSRLIVKRTKSLNSASLKKKR